jgi:hypothetical protein
MKILVGKTKRMVIVGESILATAFFIDTDLKEIRRENIEWVSQTGNRSTGCSYQHDENFGVLKIMRILFSSLNTSSFRRRALLHGIRFFLLFTLQAAYLLKTRRHTHFRTSLNYTSEVVGTSTGSYETLAWKV